MPVVQFCTGSLLDIFLFAEKMFTVCVHEYSKMPLEYFHPRQEKKPAAEISITESEKNKY